MLYEEDEIDWEEEGVFFYANLVGAVVCVAFVALISCLFLGFLTLDKLDLQVKARAAVDEDERRYATILLPVVGEHHMLLVTLLLLNAIAYESLPLFLDRLVPSWAAILLSVTFLLIFGEIIPSAIFTGPEQMRLASSLVPLVRFFIWALYPLAKPLAMLLDALVPHEEGDDSYHRGELSALVRIQYEEREAKRMRGGKGAALRKGQRDRDSLDDDKREWQDFKDDLMEAVGKRSRSNSFDLNANEPQIDPSSFFNSLGLRSRSNSFDSTPIEPQNDPLPLHRAEVRMVEGALNMKTKIAMDVYTPIRSIYSIPSDLILSKEQVTKIYAQGYSRIPVYDPHPNPKLKNRRTHIRGILMARQLILIDWDDKRVVKNLPLLIPPCVSPRMNLVDLLKLLQKGGSLMALVCAQPLLAERAFDNGKAIPVEAGFMGLVTLEDVLESVLQDRIYDEEDMSARNMAAARLTQWAAFILQRFLRKTRAKKAAEAKLLNGTVSPVNAITMDIQSSATTNDSTPLLSGRPPNNYS